MNDRISHPSGDATERFRALAPSTAPRAALEIVTLWQEGDTDRGFRLFARVTSRSQLPMRATLRFSNTRHFNYSGGVSVTSPPFIVPAGLTRDVPIGWFPRSLGSDAMALHVQTRLIACEVAA